VACLMTDGFHRWVAGQITETNAKGPDGNIYDYRVKCESGDVWVKIDNHEVKKLHGPADAKKLVNENLVIMPWEAVMGDVGMPDPVWSDNAIDLIVRKLFLKPGDLPPMWET
jgi:hypothetical protein